MRGDRRPADPAVEQSQLAEAVAATEPADLQSVERNDEVAVGDQVVVVAGIPLADDDLPRRHRSAAQPAGEALEDRRGEHREEGGPAQQGQLELESGSPVLERTEGARPGEDAEHEQDTETDDRSFGPADRDEHRDGDRADRQPEHGDALEDTEDPTEAADRDDALEDGPPGDVEDRAAGAGSRSRRKALAVVGQIPSARNAAPQPSAAPTSGRTRRPPTRPKPRSRRAPRRRRTRHQIAAARRAEREHVEGEHDDQHVDRPDGDELEAEDRHQRRQPGFPRQHAQGARLRPSAVRRDFERALARRICETADEDGGRGHEDREQPERRARAAELDHQAGEPRSDQHADALDPAGDDVGGGRSAGWSTRPGSRADCAGRVIVTAPAATTAPA